MNPLLKLQTLLRAAQLLENEAEIKRVNHMNDDDWSRKIEAKADYDEFMSMARRLSKMARRKA